VWGSGTSGLAPAGMMDAEASVVCLGPDGPQEKVREVERGGHICCLFVLECDERIRLCRVLCSIVLIG